MRKKAIIYGIGKFYNELEKSIGEKYEIIAKVDKNAEKLKGVVSLNEALFLLFDVIIITIIDIKVCFEVIKMLVEYYNVPYYKIFLGVNLKENKEWDFLDVSLGGDIVFNVDKIKIKTKNIDEFNNIKDIFSSYCYNYFLGSTSREIIIDIGMNIGGASLFFAYKSSVEKVYGFEPFEDTFIQAKENFDENSTLKSKIDYYQYGISNINEKREILFNKEMTCGQSTDVNANTKARSNYKRWKLISECDDKLLKIEVRDIKDILLKIYELHKQESVILKIDCEGEEYRILERIDEADLFQRIKVIMLEWHYEGDEKIIEILKENGYMYWSFRHSDSMGMIYAFKERNEI